MEIFFSTNLILNVIHEFEKIYIYSPSLHQDIYQKLNKCFSNYIQKNIIPNIFNEEDKDLIIDELVNDKDFEKSETEIKTFISIEELKFSQDSKNGGVLIVDDLKEKNQ